jgi:ribosomal protein S27AE
MGQHKTTETNCKHCGKTFRARNADLKIGAGMFCSRSCKNTGKHNPHFRNGGLSNYEYKLRAKDKNPKRFSAMQAVQTAVRNGSLLRKPCEVCGEGKSEAHHDDYTKPLNVRWLCRLHHVATHA